jgi:DNA-binding NtrC family response regulator
MWRRARPESTLRIKRIWKYRRGRRNQLTLPVGFARQRRILIVDDNVGDTCLITEQIERLRLPVAVDTAMTAEEGLLKIRRENYDLVLCDFKLPGITGLAFMKVSMEIRPHTPVVLVTGYGPEVVNQDADVEGLYAMLHKPVGIHVLHQIIADALAYRERIQAA